MNKQQKTTLAIGGALALGLFAALMYQVATKGSLPFDKPILEFMYSIRVAGLNTIAEMVTYVGNWETITVLCLLLLAYDKTRVPYGIPLSAVAAVTVVFNKIVKIVVARPRPDATMFLVEQGGYSFASGHAVSSMAVYGLIVYLMLRNKPQNYKKITILAALFAILVGISRIYVGVHYPSDVLAGWCEGIVIIVVAIALINKFNLPKEGKITVYDETGAVKK